MRTSLSLLSLAALATPVLSQAPRSPIRVDNSITEVFDPVLATADDCTVAAYVDGTNNSVNIVLSDGTGKAWGTPIRVDTDVTGARKDLTKASLAVFGGNIHLVWGDRRAGVAFGLGDLYYAKLDCSGTILVGETRLDGGVTPGVGTARSYEVRVSSNATNEFVYVLHTSDPNPVVNLNEALHVTLSVNGGTSFEPAIHVPQSNGGASVTDIDDKALAVSGATIYAAWQDDVLPGTGDDGFFQKGTVNVGPAVSITWLAADVQIDDEILNPNGDLENDMDVLLDASGTTVAVLFQEEPFGSGAEELYLNVSPTAAISFGGASIIAAAAGADVDSPDGAILDTGNIVVTWSDDRSAANEVYATVVSSAGAVVVTETQLSAGGGDDPDLTGSGKDLGIAWEDNSVVPDVITAAYSRNFGATWTTVTGISTGLIGDANPPIAAFNSLYGNYIISWASDDFGVAAIPPRPGDDNQFVGGFRPQTVTPNGFATLPGFANFGLSNFCPGLPGTFTIVALSLSTGSFRLTAVRDPRDLCLAPDILLSTSVPSPIFHATLDATGSGATPSIPFPPLFSGFTMHAAGISLTTAGRVAEITDVATIVFP